MSDPITIIGSDTVVNGNLEGDEDLTVEGRVEGSINLSKTLSIEVGGVVRANINVRNAIISGVLVGNSEAQESVHLTEQGRVVGDIVAPRVILVDGSSFRGNIDMGDFDIEQSVSEIPAPAVKSSPRSAPRPAARSSARTAPTPVRRFREEPTEDNEGETESEAEVKEETSVKAADSSQARRAAPIAPRTRVPVAAASSSSSSSSSRPLPQKVAAKASPPAPKVRSVGKSKAKKKK